MKYSRTREICTSLAITSEADAVSAVVQERKRAFASAGEMYAELLMRTERLEEAIKSEKKCLKELWTAVVQQEEDSVKLLTDQLRRELTGLTAESLWAAADCRVALAFPMGPFLIPEKEDAAEKKTEDAGED